MTKRNFTQIIRWLLLMGITCILLGSNQLIATQADSTSDKQEASVNLAYTLETKLVGIPPIDAAAPDVFETASFGLG
jgi:hypothetical protein